MASPGCEDTSKANTQDDLMRSLGLQRKRIPYAYRSTNDMDSYKQVNILSGVKIKDCSVVILGESCSICGQPFKCVTDVKIHSRWRHPSEAIQNERESEQRNKILSNNVLIGFNLLKKCYEQFKKDVRRRRPHKDTHTRIILKIGKEILSAINLDRKYLKNYSFNVQSNTFCDTKNRFRSKAMVHSKDATSTVRTDEQLNTTSSTASTANVTINTNTGSNETHGPLQDNSPLIRQTDPYHSDLINHPNADDSYTGNRCASVKISTQTMNDESGKTKEKGLVSIANTCKSINEHDKENRYEENVRYGNVFEEEQARLNYHRSPVRVSVESTDSSSLLSTNTMPSALARESENPLQEVMEILRIVRRKYSDIEEINHESPSRRERDLLALDGVREVSDAIGTKRSLKKTFGDDSDTNENTSCNSNDNMLMDNTIAEIDQFLSDVDKEINFSEKSNFVDYSELIHYNLLRVNATRKKLEVNNNNIDEKMSATKDTPSINFKKTASKENSNPVIIDLAYDSD